ncbi:GNAT family N-acetyltransferase [Actinomycetospora lutea]|uniref:GNAT family N-acetyltransferase n=1 Tax=Actinomycetospora lutea TaxID=663604 RepID=UPI002365C6E2|nr:GNAT family N-acetyltransferase [Actinomycetospora lutea]MDD7937956.1 GNAT family N-acetyltransferase [Actinomycetospora lutea]
MSTTTVTTAVAQPHAGPRIPVEHGVPRPGELREAPRPPTIVVRELGTGEEQVLDDVFAGLSDQSRYLRFHSPVPRMVPAVRRALAAVDGRRHVALVAVADGEPIGIARCIGLGSGRAELAIEVVDAWHGRGVGTLLLRALRDRAVAAGWQELSAEVLAENDAVRALLRKVFPVQGVERDGAELSLTLPLVDEWSWDPADLLAA